MSVPEKVGCSDSGCIFQCIDPYKGGMRTNGGCHCFENLISWNEYAKCSNREEVQMVRRWTSMLTKRVYELEKQLKEKSNG